MQKGIRHILLASLAFTLVGSAWADDADEDLVELEFERQQELGELEFETQQELDELDLETQMELDELDLETQLELDELLAEGAPQEEIDELMREAEEEVGVSPQSVELVARAAPYVTGTAFRITPVIGVLPSDFEARPDPSEVADVFEAPLDYLFNTANHQTGIESVWQTLQSARDPNSSYAF